MRVLIVTPDFPPAVGGVQTLLAGMAQGLAPRHEVTVVTTTTEGSEVYDAEKSFKIVRHARVKSRIGRLLVTLTAANAPARSADVIICGHIAVGPAVWLLSRWYSKPYFIYVHGLEVTARRYRQIIRFLLRDAKGVFTGSSYGKDLLRRYFILEEDKIDVIPPAIRPELAAAAVKPNRRTNDQKVILTVSRLDARERYKGHDTVIRALPVVRRVFPNCRYWVVGDGDDLPRLKELAQAVGVSDAVVFWGKVQDTARFYRDCDLYVMPSRLVSTKDGEKAEGFGLAFIEAAAFGKPVVAARCAGALDAVVDGETGVLVHPDDDAELAAVIIGLLANGRTRERLGAAGKRRAFEKFSLEAQARALEAAIQKRLSQTD